jgi:hypothetical protein
VLGRVDRIDGRSVLELVSEAAQRGTVLAVAQKGR